MKDNTFLSSDINTDHSILFTSDKIQISVGELKIFEASTAKFLKEFDVLIFVDAVTGEEFKYQKVDDEEPEVGKLTFRDSPVYSSLDGVLIPAESDSELDIHADTRIREDDKDE